MSTKKFIPLGDHPWVIAVVVISGLCAIIAGSIAVFAFVTGRENVPDVVRQGPTEQEKQLEEAGIINAERKTPREAAEAAFEIWVQRVDTPYQNTKYEIVKDDDPFVIVRVTAEFRETIDSDWTEKQSDVECKRVGEFWKCNQFFSFQLSNSELEKQKLSEQATAEAARLGISASGWKLYMSEVLLGNEAEERFTEFFEHQRTADEGWQIVLMRFIIENTSNSWAQIPYPLGKSGILIDSGGYEREITSLSLMPYSYYFDGNIIFVPGIQIEGVAYTQIPQNQSPEALTLSFDRDGDRKVDEVLGATFSYPLETSELEQLDDPFSKFETAVNPPGTVLSLPGDIDVTIESVELQEDFVTGDVVKTFRGGTFARIYLKVENKGGSNRNLRTRSRSGFITVFGIDQSRHYFQEIHPDSELPRSVAPGQIVEGYIDTYAFNKEFNENSKALVFVLIEGQQDYDIGAFLATN